MTKRPDMIGNQRAKGSKPNKTSFTKGQVPWNKGKKLSVAYRKKLSDARKRFFANGGIHPSLGKKRPSMTGKNNPNWGKFGKKHPKWTDDKTRPFYKAIRQLFKYVAWRKSIFELDGHSCRLCGMKGVYLEADHYPKRFIDIIRDNDIQTIDDALNCAELWNVGNGRTLCRPCHLKTPTWGNTRRLEKTVKNGLTLGHSKSSLIKAKLLQTGQRTGSESTRND